jgi:signal transduction histidine kinase/CheY-like chemotaxis protein
MVRLLAKLPEARMLLAEDEEKGAVPIALAEAHYIQWLNRILPDQLDIVEILFLGADGHLRFSLERDQNSLSWHKTAAPPHPPERAFFEASRHLSPGGVLINPIRVDPEAGRKDPRRFMNLRLISPIVAQPESGEGPPRFLGAVVMSLDVGGMAQAYRNTYWVRDDGSYLRQGTPNHRGTTAFQDFPGLEEIFRKADLGLWKGVNGEQVIWVPLFATEEGGPLWVGRRVDPSPLAEFRHALEYRVGAIVLVLFVIVILLARWIALRAERLGSELIEGIGRVLKGDGAMRFTWRKPEELRVLATNLNELAESHALKTQSLRDHAAELELSNRYKSEFLANVSHELRTPLNSILLLSKLLGSQEGGPLSPEQRKQAQVIHEAGRDLRALIDDILDLSRIEARKTTFRLERIDLPALLGRLLDLLRPQADAKGLFLKLEVDPAAPRSIVTDADKLRQILKNFLSNALKFTRTGGVTLSLRRSPEDKPERPPVRLSVADTGIGISGEKHQVIFEAFKQADGSTSRRYGGTGLGLTISRELAHLMGGTIELESQEGRGATFSLYLPVEFDRSRVEAEQLSVPYEPAPGRGADAHLPEADFGGRNILVVDDDVRNLLALTPLLERWNLRVTAAGDGVEALETLEGEESYDVVLMDIMMPEMDGYETMGAIRAQLRFAHLPIIALTAKAGQEDRNRCLAAGANDYLAKPVEATALRDALAAHLGGGNVRSYGTTDARP